MPSSLSKISIAAIVLMLVSCGSNRDLPQGWDHYKSNTLEWNGPKGYNVVLEQDESTALVKGMDTIKIFSNRDLHFPIPITLAFKKEFDAVYYDRFFDKVMMDQKVKRIFRDSVTIVDVVPIDDQNFHSGSCHNCNVVAKIKFKEKIFDFPVQMSNNIIEDNNCHTFTIEQYGTYKKIIFQAKNNCGKNGLWIGNSESSFLMITNAEFQQMEKFLKSVKYY